MAIQKKSLITNLSSTKKALVATSSSIASASPTTQEPGQQTSCQQAYGE